MIFIRKVINCKLYELNPTHCKYCDSVIPYENSNCGRKIFCNTSCSAKYNNSTLHKRNKKTRFCLFCKKQIDNKKYCSIKCQKDYEYFSFIKKWKDGAIDGLKGKAWVNISGYIRRYLFEKYDSKCCKCSWSEINTYTGKIPLEVDHIDGNHENNQEENLQLLCPNCHSLTKSYRGANRGKGRGLVYGPNPNNNRQAT